MQHFLDLVHQYTPAIIKVITFLGSAGVIDLILRKFPSQNPITILTGVQKVLAFIADLCASIDSIIDAVPGMKQNVKDPEAK